MRVHNLKDFSGCKIIPAGKLSDSSKIYFVDKCVVFQFTLLPILTKRV